MCIVENFLPALLLREFLGSGARKPPEVCRLLRVSRDPKKCLMLEPSPLGKGSVGLGVPGLSVLRDLESPTLSEKLPDLFLAALMGTLSELLLESKEDILSFPGNLLEAGLDNY